METPVRIQEIHIHIEIPIRLEVHTTLETPVRLREVHTRLEITCQYPLRNTHPYERSTYPHRRTSAGRCVARDHTRVCIWREMTSIATISLQDVWRRCNQREGHSSGAQAGRRGPSKPGADVFDLFSLGLGFGMRGWGGEFFFFFFYRWWGDCTSGL